MNLLNEKVSIQRARKDYGVVIDKSTMKENLNATKNFAKRKRDSISIELIIEKGDHSGWDLV